MSKSYDVVIAGAGLAGLSAAYSLVRERAGTKILLLEPAERLGGRAWSSDSQGIDLGGAWIWPSMMPILSKLAKEFNIKLVPQAGGYGEYRMEGGLSSVVDGLYKSVEGKVDLVRGENISAVKQLKDSAGELLISTSSPEDRDETRNQYSAKHVLLAFPPKKVLQEVEFDFEERSDNIITHELREKINNQPIWMSPAGKCALFYKERFWNPNQVMGGLPIPSMSRNFYGGFQSYDAGKSNDGKYHAIVAFVACGNSPGNVTKEQMADKVASQLGAKGGPDGQRFLAYDDMELKCWRTDAHISTANEGANFPMHPYPIRDLNDESNKNRRIWFCNSEGSMHLTGMLEGAVHNGTACAKVVAGKLNAES